MSLTSCCEKGPVAVPDDEDPGPWAEVGQKNKRASFRTTLIFLLEFTAQVISFAILFWFMFGRDGGIRVDYLAFLPVIWIAMRYGIRGIVTGLLALNFGIVLCLQLVPTSPELVTELGFLMMAFSGTGLLLGSAVTERRGIAEELNERTIFLKSLIGNSPFAIAVQDRNAGISLVNDAFLDLFQ